MSTRFTSKFWLLGIAALCLSVLPALANTPDWQGNWSDPDPGALNYVQGSAYLEDQPLNNQNMSGSQMAPGQVLHTTAGKAEVLLTPGVFLRLDDRSVVKMISSDMANTRVELLKGEAGVEVDEIHSQINLEIVAGGVTTRLMQRGFYEFMANPPKVLVFTGEAQVETGNGNHQDIKKHHEMALVAGANEKPQSLKMKTAQDGLFNWSKLRSDYLADANRQYAAENGYAAAPGWYWNPWTPGWDWAWGRGWGPGFGWGRGLGWSGAAFWGGPLFHSYPRFR